MQFVIDHSYLIPLLPLLGALVAGFFGDRLLPGRAHWPIWIGVGCSFLLSFVLLIGMIHATHGDPTPYGQAHVVYTWISAGAFTANAGFYFDPLTAVMLNVVTGIGLLITIFSAGYMKGEAGYSRFFAYLGLFVFAMTCLVMGDNLVMLYLGWEGVGLCSYLLIGYYFERPAASAAAKKAFIANRVGDFGFSVGIMLCFWAFGTVTFFSDNHHAGLLEMAGSVWEHGHVSQALNNPYGNTQVLVLKVIPFCLMLGAFGKSAQFPLYVWLPDAMEGPTPVSALIHAATMVTAGVYMIARCGTLFVSSRAALITIAAVGAFTALFAATIALRQFDLKKVFAYSTVSQLGYMFVGVGVLAPTAAVFHLVTHAFFKALLFLSAGVVMHAMLGHLDLRKMSGLKHQLPKTRWVILIGCLALAGCPLTSGFFSKDEIVGYALAHSRPLGAVLLLTSFLTAYYTFRLYFQVFEGPELVPTTPADEGGSSDAAGLGAHGTSSPAARAEARSSHEAVKHPPAKTSGVDHAAAHAHHDHEPALMLWPLYVLAAGALVAGYFGSWLTGFLGHSPSLALSYQLASAAFDTAGGKAVSPVPFGQPGGEAEGFLSLGLLLALAAFAVGVGLAYLLHLKDRQRAERLAAGLQPLTGLLEGKYWVDEIYEALILHPLAVLGKWFFEIDRVIIDSVVWAVGFVPQLGGFALKLTVQRGYLQGYAAAMFFGVLAILLLVFI
jgi:NADH-quinone oxidoreductase subunit L